MNIIYVSSVCSEDKFEDLRQKGITQKLPQAQKYHQLMIEGLRESINGNIDIISAIPTNRTWSKKIYFHSENELINNINFNYISFVNFPIIGYFSKYFYAKKLIENLCKQRNNIVIICDVLNQSIADAARSIGILYHIPVIGIVTDVPGHTSAARRKAYGIIRKKLGDYAEKCAQKKVDCYDAYIFLTKEMNDVVNNHHKPYIVIEGQCDYKMINEISVEKTLPRIAMYAGGIHKELGIERMVKAFLNADCKDWELHIYGDGNYQTEIKKITDNYENIKYFGVVGNREIVKNQQRASLLLNPRLTNYEYVKYSFPSKTLECMVSGTPLLTTKLPGMPKEYYSYIYCFDDESQEGMEKTFREILNLSNETLKLKGSEAKQFVLKNKNNIIQSKKIIDFIKDNFDIE